MKNILKVEKLNFSFIKILSKILNLIFRIGTKKLAIFLRRDYLRVVELKSSFNTKQGLKQFSSNYMPAPSKELKVVNFDSEYEITFSLVNEKPEVLDWNWNSEYYVESTLFLQYFFVNSIFIIFTILTKRIFPESDRSISNLYKFYNKISSSFIQ
jgi:hypothetical protein